MKKILALILAMVMCFSMLAACGSKDSGSTAGGTATNSGANTPKTELPSAEVTNKVDGDKGTVDQNVKYRDTVRLSVASEISNGAFYCVTSAQSTYISNMTHQALTRYDYNTSKASPELAESWRDVNGNGKVWEFKLKEGVTFQKGDQYYADLKASDVKWTYEWAAPGGPGVQEGVAVRTVTQMNQVDHIETTGDYIITFYLKSPVFDFPEMLGSWNILSEKAMEEFGHLDGQDIGTGPYYINFEQCFADQYWTLTRRDEYWGGIEQHATKNIQFFIHKDQATGVAALLAGEVDGIPSITSANALQFQNNPDYKFYNYKGTSRPSLFFNTYDGTGFFDGEDDPDQIKLRRAIKLAIDRDALCSVLYAVNPIAGGRADSLWNPNGIGYVDCGEAEFNIEKAQGMMKELGYNENNRLPLKLVFYASYTTYAQVMQDQLKAIYIDVELCEVDSSTIGTLARTGQGWDLIVNYYGAAETLSGVMTTSLHSTGSNAKPYGWASAEMDKRIDEVLAKETLEEQLAAFAEFQVWANDYVPRIPTHAGSTLVCMVAEMEGYVGEPTIDYTTIRIPE